MNKGIAIVGALLFSANAFSQVQLGGGIASGDYSTAIGPATPSYPVAQASGEQSVALGFGQASGYAAFAVGYYNDDNNLMGWASSGGIAIHGESYGGVSIGTHSLNTHAGIAIGYLSSAYGPYSNALGWRTTASGDRSTALGYYTIAGSVGGVVLGSYNTQYRKDSVTIPSPTVAHPDDPLLVLGNGTWNTYRSNAFTVYRDGTGRFEGGLQIRAGTGYLTLSPGGTTSRTLVLPDADATLLSNESQLNATKLTGEIPSASLPADVTRLGSTVDLSSSAVSGELPWSKVAPSTRPNTLAGYGITDGLAVARNAAGRITTAIHIEPQGDIPMFAP